MKPRIVITGVAGFIGSNLAVTLLEQGYQVVGIDNLAYGLLAQIPDGVEFHQADIRSVDIADVFDEGDVVFHLAAKNCISDCQSDPVETASINVMGTANVLHAAGRKKTAKVVYAESSALYEGTDVFPTPEAEVAPQSFYAVSKLCSMHFALAFERWQGLNLTGLRYFNVYGPRQDYRRTIPPVMSAFILKLRRGEPGTIYGAGDKRRDFIHVDDVNTFHQLCIQEPKTNGRIFNLGSGRSYSVNEIYELISKVLEVDHAPIHQDELPGESFMTQADIEEARALGWEPSVSLEAGVRSMIRYFDEHDIH